VIPGATPLSAALHHARTVCRRAERRVRSAAREHAVPEGVPVYLNRLSDLLFVLARWADRAGTEARTTFKERL
jgi:cob(I)alamin adenosyltransferase